jgi:hypothetical protein
MRRGGRYASADFAEMFSELLDAARLNPDRLLTELRKQGQLGLVERATVYDWKGGQHLPGDEVAFRAVVRVCLQQARQHGVRPLVADEADWLELLREARLSRESSRSSGPIAAHGERRGSAIRAVGDWDPVALGVHKAIGGNPLPAFVRRAHDDLLDAALDPDARASRLIVLRGGPSTGKSRSAYHAVCKGPLAAWRLEYPPIPAELARLLEEGVPPRTVIWLRELRDYADAEGGQEALARLARLLVGNGRVIAITTTWDGFWNAYSRDHRGGPGTRDPYLAARALLAGLPEVTSVSDVNPGRGGVIEVPEEFRESELAQARQLPDPALAEAIAAAARENKPGRVIQYLAGVPDLLHHYEGPGADPYARAVITTAMDVARVAGLRRCTPGFLHRAAVGYLAAEYRVSASDDRCGAAIDTAATELRGAVRALTPEPHKQGTQVASYRLADYLDQHGRKIFAETIPPPEFWAAATHSKPGVQAKFGKAAADRGLLKTGAQLLKNATEADAYAAVRLLRIMQPLHPADTRPAAWAAARADLTNPEYVALLINELHYVGAHAQLKELLQRDPAAHADTRDLYGVCSLIEALHQVGAASQVSALLADNSVANAAGDDYGIMFLLPILHKVGAIELLRGLAERAVASDDVTGPCWTAELLMALHQIGADEQIAALLARDPGAHAKVTELEPFHAIEDLIMMLQRAGADAQATAFAERVVADADPDDLISMSTLLITMHQAGKEMLVRDLLRSDPVARVDPTETSMVAALLDALVFVSADAEVAALLARDPAAQASLDDPWDVARLLEVMREAGADGAVRTLLARDPAAHVDQSNPASLVMLLRELGADGANTISTTLLDRLPGAGAFEMFLRYNKPAQDYRFGRAHGGRPATPWSWDDLE